MRHTNGSDTQPWHCMSLVHVSDSATVVCRQLHTDIFISMQNKVSNSNIFCNQLIADHTLSGKGTSWSVQFSACYCALICVHVWLLDRSKMFHVHTSHIVWCFLAPLIHSSMSLGATRWSIRQLVGHNKLLHTTRVQAPTSRPIYCAIRAGMPRRRGDTSIN